MRIRVFTGADFETAQSLVRGELGDDALILETREAGDAVEIVALAGPVEAESEAPPCLPPLPPDAPDVRATPEPRDAPSVEERRARLAWHGLSGALAERLLEDDLAHALTKAVRFDDLPLGENGRPLLLAGEPGAGKSLTLVKLATRLVLAGRRPLVISADGRKAGAVEQLATLTRLLGLELVVANEARTLRLALSRRVDGAPVLIDGPGLSLREAEDEAELRALAEAVDAEPVFVTPAGTHADEAAEAAERHAALGARRMIATRLDVGRRLGGILSASFRAGLSLTEAGIGAGATDGLETLTARGLAERLLAPDPPAARPPWSARIPA